MSVGRLLPDGGRAKVAQAKLTGYLLNPEHPDGGPHARDLAQFLGYGRGDADRLREELLAVAAACPVARVRAGVNPSGAVQYAVEGVISGPNGRHAPIFTGWQIDEPGVEPRLITAFLIGGPLDDPGALPSR